ncbi:recombinase family protein [Acidiphilium sp.]|uniref:recombinase family protein n=1 Tax=Acidiphilium sp. TaxID=527 RepID=UPI003D02D7C1
MQRPAFRHLVDRLEADDVLVVTKLDRLSRNAMDVWSTVDALAAIGVRVHCLALSGGDLTSSPRRMTMQVIASVAEFERDLLVEHTLAGLIRARSTGKALGRPTSLNEEQKRQIVARLDAGSSVSALAREYQTSRQTIIRARFRLTSHPNERTL